MKYSIAIINRVLLSVFLFVTACKVNATPGPAKQSRLVVGGEIKGVNDTTLIFRVFASHYIPYLFRSQGRQITADVRNGKFKVEIKGLKGPAYVDLGIALRCNIWLPSSIYLVEPSDSVFIRRDAPEGKLEFSGKGAERWRAQYEVVRIPVPTPQQSDYKLSFAELNLRIRSYADSMRTERTRVLDRSRKYFSAFAYEVLSADFTGDIDNNEMVKLWINLRNTLPRKVEFEPFLAQAGKLATSPVRGHYSDSVSHTSRVYASYLMHREKVLAWIRNYEAQGKDVRPDLRSFTDLVSKQYSGRTREKMLALFFLEEFHAESDPGDLSRVLALVEDAHYRSVLEDLGDTRQPLKQRKPAFNFALPDTTGRLVRLSDFRGKVVVVDYWFTGCLACKQLADAMRELVIPLYEKQPKVVFVSISADADPKLWRQTVRSGAYTHPGSVTLRSGSFDHPLYKYYQFFSSPKLQVIDKAGNLVIVDLQKQTAELTASSLVTMLERLL
jgi:hypothetical protein